MWTVAKGLFECATVKGVLKVENRPKRRGRLA